MAAINNNDPQFEIYRKRLFDEAKKGNLVMIKALAKKNPALLSSVDKDGFTILHYAAFGNLDVVQWLLSDEGRAAGFNSVLAKADRGNLTALHCAAYRGHLETCKAIVEGCKVENGEREQMLNALTNDGCTVLHYAAVKGHTSIVKWLLSEEKGGGREAGFNSVLTKEKEKGTTALHRAAQHAHLECFKAIVEGCKVENGEREKILNAVINDGLTVLHYAAAMGNTSIVNWLLSDEKGGGREAGFNNVLATIYEEGWTASHLATQRGNLECVIKAIVEGCKVENGEREQMLNAVTNDGATLLFLAAYHNQISIIKWLMSEGRCHGFTSILTKAKCGMTAFHVAAEKGHLDACKAIAEGCKVENGEREQMLNAVTNDGATLLYLAAYHNQISIIKWLMSEGRRHGFTSILTKAKCGMTAFHVAAEKGHLDASKAIVYGCRMDNGERKKILNACAMDGNTALHLAARNGHTLIVSWLLPGVRALGFDSVLTRTVTHGTPILHLAAQRGHLETCKAIVEGCKVENGEREKMLNGIDLKGITPLHLVTLGGDMSILSWLLSNRQGGGRALGFDSVLTGTVTHGPTLLVAARYGLLEAFVERRKVENGEREKMLNGIDLKGFTPLHFVTFGGDTSIASWHLSNRQGGGRALGFDSFLARTVTHGTPALHCAANSGHLETCKAIVEGCKVENGEREQMLNALTNDGCTVLHCAILRNRTDIVSWLLSDEEGGGRANGLKSETITAVVNGLFSPLHYSAYSGSAETLRALLSGCTGGERLKLFLAVDKRGWTLLHFAARFCQPAIIRELLLHHEETKMIVDHRDHRGMTALHRVILDGGVDEESKKEWKSGVKPDDPNLAPQEEVVAALLTYEYEDEREDGGQVTHSTKQQQHQQVAFIDINLGLKIEMKEK